MTDLATTDLEERMSEVFTRRLRAMDGKANAGRAKFFKAASSRARSQRV